MLYKNNSKELSKELFKNPTAEYRGAPFWGWNCELEEDELLRQIEVLKEMGFGGYHIHCRSGLATKYLGDEFMNLVKACVNKSKKEGMFTWLYDEDRYPSGSAGGYVTKIKKYRQRRLVLSCEKNNDAISKEDAVNEGKPYFVASYDICLNDEGKLSSYRRIEEDDAAKNQKYYIYCVTSGAGGWHNGQGYVDAMNPEAVRKFIEITYERYKDSVGEEFGKTIPAIFTDEPAVTKKIMLPFPKKPDLFTLPWTPELDSSFKETYKFDILDKLPEIIWEMPDGKVSRARYCFHNHIADVFTTSFFDQIGKWCEENGIYFTGHLEAEADLYWQTAGNGDLVRAYRAFGLPGIDICFNGFEFTTAKQAQSMVHQYGREGLLSEMYGVTNWDFDFRGHKLQGDWQAAMGVTVRVPHLSWVSMKGSAKRDFPASINYQSPWYTQYSCIEDHFSRIATALTRGKPCVNIGVIHPIESYWLHWGPTTDTYMHREQLESNFKNFIEWMLFNTVDFDYICEATLPSQINGTDAALKVGEMSYSTVIVPGCETIRRSTLEILNDFAQRGGKLIFTGECPRYVDGEESDDVRLLYENAIVVPFEKNAILNAVKHERDIDIMIRKEPFVGLISEMGKIPERFIYQLREDNDCKWLFLAYAKPYIHVHNLSTPDPLFVEIKVKGEYTPLIYDTLTGEIRNVTFRTSCGYTYIDYDFFEHDSLLLKLGKKTQESFELKENEETVINSFDIKKPVEKILEEGNVCLLDLAEYSFNGAPWCEREQVLKIDEALRKKLSWSLTTGTDKQPWLFEKEKITDFVTLRYVVNCETELRNLYFCAEELEELTVNGESIPLKQDGYFVDKAIRRFCLPKLSEGENIILAKHPFGKRIGLEASYITGDFDVQVMGCTIKLLKPNKIIGFGDIVSQGMPFYGGNVVYRTEIDVPENCDVRINIGKYVGALTKVYIDGEDKGNIVFAPYDLTVKDVEKGKHTVEFKLFGNRHNTFGALHCTSDCRWYGSQRWYSEKESWSYEYNTRHMGILKSPVITYLK